MADPCYGGQLLRRTQIAVCSWPLEIPTS